MSSERDRRIRIRALLDAGKKPKEIAMHLGVSLTNVYEVRGSDDLERKSGSGRKRVLDLDAVKVAVEADPTKSLRSHANDMGAARATFHKAVKQLGEEPGEGAEADDDPQDQRVSSALLPSSAQ